jgi:hypothetical protein
MVAGNETFYQVVPQKSVANPAASPAAPAQRTAAAH